MAGSTFTAHLMLVVHVAIISMMVSLGMAGLADAVPWRVAFIECKMVGL
jgi:hypothetical protein